MVTNGDGNGKTSLILLIAIVAGTVAAVRYIEERIWTADRWTATQMHDWAVDLERGNPGLVVPDTRAIERPER
jgi:hypothetical protein